MKKVKILCADGLEQCEALIVHDLLKRAMFEVDLVNIHDRDEVTSSHLLNFKTNQKLSELNDDFDALFLPGGLVGTNHLRNNQTVRKLVKDTYEAKKLVSAVCAAPDIFADLGLVGDLEFTCYPGCDLHAKASNEKVVKKGNIISGQALGASFHLAYEIIKFLNGEEAANATLNEVYFTK